MAALCIYAYHNVSSTDTACVWNVPGPSSKSDTILKLQDIYPPSKPQYQAVKRLANEDELKRFQQDLGENIVGFSWLLQPEPTSEAFIIPLIEDILFSSEYFEAADKKLYFTEKCAINEATKTHVTATTKGQSSNPNWLLARKYRLTASKFGIILGACRRGRFSEPFFKRLLDGYNLGGVKAIQWGAQHEKTALETFSLATSMAVESTGLWLHSCGYLGASPDSLVRDDALVEAKCPYKFRNDVLSEVLKHNKTYIIFKNQDNQTVVNKSHDYYDQIQGQLYLCGKKCCYLVVWTPQETEIVEIEKDLEWSPNIEVLKNFYLDKYIPYILKNK